MGKGNKYTKSIGKKIKLARVNSNLTQEELAEEIGISSRYVSQLERGLAFGSANTIVNICKTLNIDSNFLFDELIETKDSQSISNMIDPKFFKSYNKLNEMNKQIIDLIVNQLVIFQESKSSKNN